VSEWSREISGGCKGRPCRRQRRSSAGWASEARVQCATASRPLQDRLQCSTVLLRLGSRDADASRAERLSLRPFLFLMATPADFISRGGLLVAPELRRPADRRFLGDQADSFINSSSTSRRAAPFPDTERPSCIQRAAHQKAERPGQRQTPMTLPDACPPTPTDRSPYRSGSVASASR